MADKRLGKHPHSNEVRTVQSDAEAGNINNMAGRVLQARMRGNPDGRKPMFMEVPSESFHEMLNKVTQVQHTFQRIPARIRSRFANSPAVMMDWLQNPDNRIEAVKLGLIDDPEIRAQLEEAASQAARMAARRRSNDPFEDESQLDLEEEANKADEEAQPSHKPPKKGGKERK